MPASKKPDLAILTKDSKTEIATFKNSLRRWQEQWKAQKAARQAAQEVLKCLISSDRL
jgi:hypothetical protein